MFSRNLTCVQLLVVISLVYSAHVGAVENVTPAERATIVAGTMVLPEGEILKDPTQPYEWAKPRVSSKAQRTYKLNYLLYATERKQAIINGKTVNVGDRVHGAKVVKITESSVLLSVEGGTKVLRWKQPMSIKRTR